MIRGIYLFTRTQKFKTKNEIRKIRQKNKTKKKMLTSTLWQRVYIISVTIV